MEKYLQFQWGISYCVSRLSHVFHIVARLSRKVSSLKMADTISQTSTKRSVTKSRCYRRMLQLVEQKGVFCYDYIDKHERLFEMKFRLASNFTTGCRVRSARGKYARAQKVWRNFKCGNIGDYMKLYFFATWRSLVMYSRSFETTCSSDISSIRRTTLARLSFHGAQCSSYRPPDTSDHGSGNVSHDSAEHPRKPCHASGRYAHANNKFMGPLYDRTKPSSYILYVNANNLYGWALSQPLLDDEFECVSADDCRDAMVAF